MPMIVLYTHPEVRLRIRFPLSYALLDSWACETAQT
jgi:hypothetical protein